MFGPKSQKACRKSCSTSTEKQEYESMIGEEHMVLRKEGPWMHKVQGVSSQVKREET